MSTSVVTVGAGMFADAVAGQAVAVERVDWRPPMPGTQDHLAAVATDPRRPEANRRAVEAARRSRDLPVVVACVGTEEDPQGLSRQAEALAAAGAEVFLSNAQATRRALDLLEAGA